MNRNDIGKISVCVVTGFLIGFFAAGISELPLKNQILYSTFIGAVGAFLSFFLQFTYAEGHIFYRYYRWLEGIRDNKKHILHGLENPLGLCAYCQNMWITIIFFGAGFMWLDLKWYMFFASTGIAHFALALLDKMFWQDSR